MSSKVGGKRVDAQRNSKSPRTKGKERPPAAGTEHLLKKEKKRKNRASTIRGKNTMKNPAQNVYGEGGGFFWQPIANSKKGKEKSSPKTKQRGEDLRARGEKGGVSDEKIKGRGRKAANRGKELSQQREKKRGEMFLGGSKKKGKSRPWACLPFRKGGEGSRKEAESLDQKGRTYALAAWRRKKKKRFRGAKGERM